MSSVSLPAHAPGDADDDPGGLVGRVLDGRYRVIGLLGVGGIGRVYRAEHLVLKRPVAIKVLLEHYACVPDLQRRFEREAMALATLSHPNIVTITDFVANRDVTFLVMELLEGEDLDALLARGPMAPHDALSVMEQILSSLAYAHQRDVIHRDLKPQNVLVRRLPGDRLHAEILDFGLAKFMDGSGPSANLTKTGLIVGTPAYMAPEQASGARADQRADVYAAGLMLYEMLAGSHPFAGFEGAELLRQHLLKPPDPIAERCPEARVAPELEAFFARALAKDGANRFADGETMLEAFLALPPDCFVPGDAPPTRERGIAHANTRLAVPAAPTVAGRPNRRSSRRLPALAVAGTLLVAAGVAAWALWPPSDAPTRGPDAPIAGPATSSVDEPAEAEPSEATETPPSAASGSITEASSEDTNPSADEDPDADDPAWTTPAWTTPAWTSPQTRPRRTTRRTATSPSRPRTAPPREIPGRAASPRRSRPSSGASGAARPSPSGTSVRS